MIRPTEYSHLYLRNTEVQKGLGMKKIQVIYSYMLSVKPVVIAGKEAFKPASDDRH